MKRIISLLTIFISCVVFSQKVSEINKTVFSKEALAQKITSQNGKKLSVSEVLKNHEGKILIIDFWASWCRDCIVALPSTKELKEKILRLSLSISHSTPRTNSGKRVWRNTRLLKMKIIGLMKAGKIILIIIST